MIDPYDPVTVGYHLFLEPTGTLAESLEANIERLAKSFDAPIFAPHVTLLARIPDAPEVELIATTESLAASMKPFSITLGGLGMEDRYFRALYAFVEPRDELTSLHRAAARAFGMPETPGYVPHLSLLYGNYTEAQKHSALPEGFDGEGTVFEVSAVHLWRTPGSADTWERVARIPLGGV